MEMSSKKRNRYRIMSILLLLCLLVNTSAFAGPKVIAKGVQAAVPSDNTEELRGVWFSYLDWMEMPSDPAAFQMKADRIMADIRSKGINAIFCHVHSHSDSYGKKLKTFPESKFVPTGKTAPQFDPLAYMIQSAHKHGLKFHAWMNPYRVTGYRKSWDDVPADSVLKTWVNNGNILLHEGQYYLNPARKEVQDLLVQSVTELMKNYPVDGVQFDDYFYPSLAKGQAFDTADYQASASSMSLADWRRNNVSTLIHRVHDAVHAVNAGAVFGVSPIALLSGLRNEKAYFVDIDLWMRSNQYVDYIMPQIYHGFEAKNGQGQAAPHAFATCLADWVALKNQLQSPVKLYVGLALYKCGSNVWDGNTVPEWLRYPDILMRQVQYARETGAVSGFGIYDYQNFDDPEKQQELLNLQKVFS